MKGFSCSHSRTTLAADGDPPATIEPEGEKHFQVFHRVSDIPLSDWQQLVPADKHCMHHDFLKGIEETGTMEMDFRYVMGYQGDRPIAFAYFQIITFDVGRIDPYAKKAGKSRNPIQWLGRQVSKIAKDISKRFSVKIVLLGNAFLTGEHGLYLHPTFTEAQAFRTLPEILDEIRVDIGPFHAVLLKDFFPGEHHPETELLENGYHLFFGIPI